MHKDKFPHSWRLETCRFAECRCRMPICAVAPCCAPSYRRTLILQRALQRAAVCSLRGRAGCIPTVQRTGVQAPYIPCVQHDWVNELQSIYHHRDLQHTHCSTAEHGTGLGLTLNIEKIVIFRSKSNKTTYYNNCSVTDLPLSTQQLTSLKSLRLREVLD